MLTLRPEQITLFEHAQADYVRPRMLQHLKETLPRYWQVIGEPVIQQAVDQGMDRASHYGFTSRDTVRFFLELTLLLGHDFPDDPQLPWVKQALAVQARGSELDQARNLHDAAMLYLESVHGEEGSYFDAACQRLLAEPMDIATGSREKFESTVMIRLDHLWPQKYQQLGEHSIRELIKRGLKASAKQGIKLESGAFLQVCLMFLLGHRVEHNPNYPWASTVTTGEPAQRVAQRHQATLAYLQRWCEQPSYGAYLPARPSASAVQGHPYEQPLEDPDVRAALQQAWQDSQADDPEQRHIEGGYITRLADGRFMVERWPTGQRGGITPLPLDRDGRHEGQEVLGEFRTQPHPTIDEQGRKWRQGFQPHDRRLLATEPYIGTSYLLGRESIWQWATAQADVEPVALGSRDDVLNP